jgi:hypothetical protein
MIFPKVIEVSGLVRTVKRIKSFNEFTPHTDEFLNYYLYLRNQDDVELVRKLLEELKEEVKNFEKDLLEDEQEYG